MDDKVFFFSYARYDADKGKDCLLDKLYLDLESRIGARLARTHCGYKDTRMDTGTIWPKAHIQALKNCPVLVFVLSPYYLSSNYCGKELAVYFERSEHMQATFPQLPNLIFPIRWIPLTHSKIPVPDNINALHSSNYGMTGDIMKDGLKKLIEKDPQNYHRFLNGLVDDILDAFHKLEREAPDFLSRIPPIENIKTIPPKVSDPSPDDGPGPDKPKIPSFIWLVMAIALVLTGLVLYWFTLPSKPEPCCSNHCLDPFSDNRPSPKMVESAPILPALSPQPNSSLLTSTSDLPLTFASGANGKSFSKLFADINTVCGKSIPLLELLTTGGRDNLMALASKNADLGPVGVDVYHAMKVHDDGIGKLKALVALPTDLLHIVVLKSGYQTAIGNTCDGIEIMGKCFWGAWKPVCQTRIIRTEKDLQGLTVATIGSAQVVADSYLNPKLRMNLNIINVVTDSQAFGYLKNGKVQAVLTLSAYPSGPIQALKHENGFTLANWESGATDDYTLTKKGYANLGALGITFLSSQIILMVRPVEDHNGSIGKKIAKLKSCLIEKLPELKDGAQFQPAWADIKTLNPPDDIPSW